MKNLVLCLVWLIRTSGNVDCVVIDTQIKKGTALDILKSKRQSIKKYRAAQKTVYWKNVLVNIQTQVGFQDKIQKQNWLSNSNLLCCCGDTKCQCIWTLPFHFIFCFHFLTIDFPFCGIPKSCFPQPFFFLYGHIDLVDLRHFPQQSTQLCNLFFFTRQAMKLNQESTLCKKLNLFSAVKAVNVKLLTFLPIECLWKAIDCSPS